MSEHRHKSRVEPVFLDPEQIEAQIHSLEEDVLCAIAGSAALNEDLALALLKRSDLTHAVMEAIAKNGRIMRNRKVRAAVLAHHRTPRHVSLPLIRHLYTFDLMQVGMTPGIAADVAIASEEALINRLDTLAAGEKLTLAKRSSARVAAVLLNDVDNRIVAAGLNNPYLTDSHIVKAILQRDASELLAFTVSHHSKWSVRKEIRGALLRNEFTPFACAISFSQSFSVGALKELLSQSRLPVKIKTYLLEVSEKRKR